MKKFLTIMGCFMFVLVAGLTLGACGGEEKPSTSSLDEFANYIETTFAEKEIKFEKGFKMESFGEGDLQEISVSRTLGGYNVEQVYRDESGTVYSRVHLVDGKYYEYVLTDDSEEIKTVYADENEFSTNKNSKTPEIYEDIERFAGDLTADIQELLLNIENQQQAPDTFIDVTKLTKNGTTTFEFKIASGISTNYTKLSFRNGFATELTTRVKVANVEIMHQSVVAFGGTITAPTGYTPFSAE